MRIQSDKFDNDSVVSRSKEWGNIPASIEFVNSQELPKHSVLLDIGCHTGSLIHNLKQQGYCHVQGIDIDRRSVRRGQSLYPELENRIKTYEGVTLPYQDESFDVVTMFDVIEHIPELERFISLQVKRILKQDGILILQTPNKFTNIPWEILIHRSFTRYKSYHVSLQSYRSLKHLLTSGGFVDVTIEKRDVCTPYYLSQLDKYIGRLAYPLMSMINCLPVSCTANFWVHCRKENQFS